MVSDKPETDLNLPPGVVAQAAAIAANSAEVNAKQSSTASLPQTSSNGGTGSSASFDTPRASTQDTATPGFSGIARENSSNPGAVAENTNVTDAPARFTQEPPIEDAPRPAYSEAYGQVDVSQDGFDTRAMVASDGRVDININQKTRRLSNLLVPALQSQLNLHSEGPPTPPSGYIPPSLAGLPGEASPPPLNVVIHVVGSRGDVQPFVALGQVLKKTYGHRVRLATHPTFREFVEENGLEFFSIGGDPAELMAFMVKNPGLMPGMDSLRSGEIGKRRKGMYEIVKGCWRACFEAGDGTGIEASDEHLDSPASFDSGISVSADLMSKPFVADAIIANPPSFAHIHCAEKLGIPLHLMFTMPWSPTQAFPHPLANIQSTNADANMTNFVTYALVEMMTWQGLGDVINRFREKSLGLEPVSLMWAPGMASRLRIPYTYCWSPALIPKPKDWGQHIFVSGFYFLSLADNYSPPPDLAEFLDAGPPPVYIGFGSIVVDNPNAMTKLIFDAIKQTGQRALVSKGWGGFGADALGIPEGVFMLGNIPHDWLFKRVSCVVHHGGAGTTAAGIALGKPTVVVPFFGDQPFWGAMVAKAGAGPSPIPSKQLTSENLAAAIMEALKPAALQRAQELGARVSAENGSDVGAETFHKKLGVDTLRCSLSPDRAAVWRVKRTEIRLSAFAAAVLGNEGLLDFSDLKLYRPREYDSEDGPWDPITGATSALLGTIGSLMMGVADFPVEVIRAVRESQSGDLTRPSVTPRGSEANIGSTQAHSASTSSGNGKSSSTTIATTSSVDTQGETSTQSPIDPRSRHDSSTSLSDASSLTSDPIVRGHSMAEAIGKTPSRSTSGKRSGSRTPTSPHRSQSDHRTSQISLDSALGAGKGVGRIVGAGLKSPMDFTLGLARGFHNAPKLYGDESVRQPERITGFQSGLKAAGKEFGFGFYDGISGLVTQPLDGAKKEGVAGLLKGFGKGIGGIVLKPGAAIWGIPGYTFKGIYKELQKHMGSSVQNYIIAARTAQGFDDWRTSTPEERRIVISHWHTVQVELGKQKTMSRRHRSENKRKQKQDKAAKPPTSESATVLSHAQTPKESFPTSSKDGDLEEAIRKSAAATSKGNPAEDKLVEQAIRASVAELRLNSEEGNSDDAVQRALRASVPEAAQAQQNRTGAQSYDSTDGASDSNGRLDASLRMSMQRDHYQEENSGHQLGETGDDSGIDTDDDEYVKAALEDSKLAFTSPSAVEVDGDLLWAIEQSKLSQQTREQAESRRRVEEEIVLEYIKKQSLEEEQYRQSLVAKGKEQ